MQRTLFPLLAATALALAPAAQTIDLRVFLTGANSVGPNPTTAAGKAQLSFDPATGAFDYDVQVSGMAATIAHVHFAPAGANGGVVFALAPAGPNLFQGNTLLTPAEMSSLLSNHFYVNVHSGAFPGGHVRGQIEMPEFLAAPLMDGASEVPPSGSSGEGLGLLRYDAASKTFSYDVTFSGLGGPATSAHLHNAPAGSGGPVVFPLSSVGPNQYKGVSAALSDAAVASLLSGNTYLNIHTAGFPGGEIRGQVGRAFLNSDGPTIGVANGGSQILDLRAGPSHAGELYVLLGSASGTSPGFPAAPGIQLPLNFDGYFNFTLGNLNSVPLINSLGFLSATGEADLQFLLPTGASAALVGVHLDHAAVLLDPGTGTVTHATNAVGLDLK